MKNQPLRVPRRTGHQRLRFGSARIDRAKGAMLTTEHLLFHFNPTSIIARFPSRKDQEVSRD